MDSRSNDNYAELPSVETPEDVAVLYSWANLHGAKYRDFSASRREYRAQLRHRAAEQARETELRAQAEAESAAAQATTAAREAEAEVRATASQSAARQQALREVEAAAQRASAERIEALRRADAAAQAQAQARREEREMAEAQASARRQETLYRESNSRRPVEEAEDAAEVPGSISDPYTPQSRQPLPQAEPNAAMEPPVETRPSRLRAERAASDSGEGAAMQPASLRSQEGDFQKPQSYAAPAPGAAFPDDRAYDPQAYDPWIAAAEPNPLGGMPATTRTVPERAGSPAPRRPQGYRPDDASGVRQIYRPELDAPKRRKGSERVGAGAPQRPLPVPAPVPPYAKRETTLPQAVPAARQPAAVPAAGARERQSSAAPRAWTAAPSLAPHLAPQAVPQPAPRVVPQIAAWSPESVEAERTAAPGPFVERRRAPEEIPPASADLAGETADPAPRRRRQDQPGYRVTDSDRAIAAYRREQGQAHAVPAPLPQHSAVPAERPREAVRPAEPVLPAWIHEQQPSGVHELRSGEFELAPQELASETLQRSRERVASRWYALKGVFEQPGQERVEPQPARQRETRTPVLAVFSFAGGVGKTSLVATLGRSLSSLGEKVLLTDTTSHGLLPFYFGASELRESTVRTFSPPSGSTDAPIYLVNYAVDQSAGDEAAQEAVIDGITESGRGAHRILLDLTSSTSWLIRRMAHLSPTILVPLAPDMNSVISLQPIERFLQGVDGPDGTPLKVFYVLNQFDAGLPLHLDVREVLRRQLGERLLPTVIRRAPAVSEALAEGMTIIDYAADAPVADDYLNVANWLRTVSAPATAGFRNVRWSER